MVGDGYATIITSSYTLNPNDDDIGAGLEYLSASEFKNSSSFAGWDFNKICEMGKKHPELR